VVLARAAFFTPTFAAVADFAAAFFTPAFAAVADFAAAFFTPVRFIPDFFTAAFFTAALLTATFFTATFLTATFLGARFLAAVEPEVDVVAADPSVGAETAEPEVDVVAGEAADGFIEVVATPVEADAAVISTAAAGRASAPMRADAISPRPIRVWLNF
jgi:Zn-dependent protease with chaperone function